MVASAEVVDRPLAPVMNRVPHELRCVGLKFVTMSRYSTPPLLPLHDQPMSPIAEAWALAMMASSSGLPSEWLKPNSQMQSARLRLRNESTYALTSAAVSKTPYIWMLKMRLPVLSAARTWGALSRMENCQSWPQFGASIMIVCWKPALRSRWVALVVACGHLGVTAVLLNGLFPMLRMT